MILSRLIYFSKPSGVGDEDIAKILTTSRANNYADNISGVLFYSSSHFIQLLEGGRRPLTRCFTRIAQDSRHIDVTLVEFTTIDSRRFVEWSMGFIGSDPGHDVIMRRYTSGSFDPATVTAPNALANLLFDLSRTLPAQPLET